MLEGTTIEDAHNAINYCLNFRISIPDEDVLFLYRLCVSDLKTQPLSEEDHTKLKLLLCKMIVHNNDPSFEDKLWDTPKESAKKILSESDE